MATRYWLGRKRPNMVGENHPRWAPKTTIACPVCNIEFTFYTSRPSKFCSKQCVAKSMVGKPAPMRGRKRPDMVGEKNRSWKGGITPINEKVRKSLKYLQWRIAVFERDNYTCQICGKVGGSLQADHIKPFSAFPELRFEMSNGRTLCAPCHRGTDTYGGKLFKQGVFNNG